MPVYIRKNVSYTPPSLDKLPQEQEDDFVNDPELIRDDLPQPYRMIDKTVRNLIDDTWEIISQREEARLEEERKIKPPQYEFSIKFDSPIPGTQFAEKQTLSYATAACNSPDGSFIFFGLPCGLAVLNTSNSQFQGSWEEENAEITYIKCYTIGPEMYLLVTIDDMGTSKPGFVWERVKPSNSQFQGSWEEENAEITYIKCYTIGPEMYLLVTIDDMGIGRLFAYTYGRVFLLKVLNSQESDNVKILVSKIEASSAGDYMGVVMENPSTQDIWLEVHKLPRDPWVSDLETIVNALKKKEEKKEEAISEDAESIVASEQAGSQVESQDGAPSVAPTDAGDQPQNPPSVAGSLSSAKSIRFNLFSRGSTKQQSKKSRPASEISQPGPSDPVVLNIEQPKDPLSGDYKFAAPQLIMKVTPPPQVTGATVTNLHTTCQKVESGDVVGTGATVGNLHTTCQKVESGDVIGTGQNSLFTQAHLEMRKNVFDSIHENLLKYLPQDEETQVQQYPNFHFLTPGRMLPMGLEQPTLQGRPTIIAVWWPGSNNLIQYSLIKTSKEVEFKPDLVWPFTCKITTSEVSDDTNIIAVGLENGNVVIWDRYMGIQRGVVTVGDNVPVVQLKFLNPNMYPQDTSSYPPYPTKVSAYLLVMCANSSMYSIATGPGIPLQPQTLSLPVESDDDSITLLQPFSIYPDMLLTVTRKGGIQVRDTLMGKILLQVKLPEGFEISSPWEPILALGENGKQLYVKGTQKVEEDGSEMDCASSQLQNGSVFVYQLRSFPTLDEYWKIERTSTQKVEEDGSEMDGASSQLQNGSVFVYQLRSFPTLDEYWKKERTSQPFTVHTTIEQRVDALLADRISKQEARKNRLIERWSLLKNEVESIHALHSMAEANRQIVTPGSVGLHQFA